MWIGGDIASTGPGVIYDEPTAGAVEKSGSSSPAFNKALCDCVRESRDRRPWYWAYGWGLDNCGDWANRMWDCACKRMTCPTEGC